MSYYTNDIDTLRQLISQSFPQILISAMNRAFGVHHNVLYYCLWLTLIVLAGTAVMLIVTKKIGGGSARYFVKQQQAIAEEEGYVEEMLVGQKVIKTFCHEEAAEKGFDEVNEKLYDASRRANRYANMLAPALFNIGNVLYVVLAVVGGVLVAARPQCIQRKFFGASPHHKRGGALPQHGKAVHRQHKPGIPAGKLGGNGRCGHGSACSRS